jgi:MoxR-like ATPase
MADNATTITVIEACGRAGVPVLLLSDPGVGKSSAIKGLAAAQGLPAETVIGSIREPADIGGLPFLPPDGRGMVLEPPAWAKRLCAARAGYLFLDELTTSPPAVQAAMLAVTLDRTVGEQRLPDGVVIVAAANPPDRAADGWELSPPLANRLCHVPYEPTAEEWIEGTATGWSAPPASRAITGSEARRARLLAMVAGFIRTRPALLDAFPAEPAAAAGPWPSRRTWTMTAAALAHVHDSDTEAVTAITFGLVGQGAGREFLTWRLAADLPDPETVLADPSVVNWADPRADRTWAVLSGVIALAAARGTAAAWRAAWGPVMAAADGGAPDVATAGARMLGRCRPPKAAVPAEAGRFRQVLAAARLVPAAGAA